jgi:LPXTG-motif cell wall-anchored protein
VKLLADGKDTGRTITLSLKNGWENTFRGLPYEDRAGNVISYTVEEVWSSDQWTPAYAEVKASGGSVPTYRTSINNQYIPGLGGPILPSTGSAVRMMYVFIGGGMMLLSVIWGIVLRCKRERRRG